MVSNAGISLFSTYCSPFSNTQLLLILVFEIKELVIFVMTYVPE